MAFVKLGTDLFNSDLIAVVHPHGKYCLVYMQGHSLAEDGLRIDLSIEEIEDELNKLDSAESDLFEQAAKLKDEIDNGKKSSHKAVAYENPAQGMDQCKDCVYYADVNDCDLVKPPIAATGWCKRFKSE